MEILQPYFKPVITMVVTVVVMFLFELQRERLVSMRTLENQANVNFLIAIRATIAIVILILMAIFASFKYTVLGVVVYFYVDYFTRLYRESKQGYTSHNGVHDYD